MLTSASSPLVAVWELGGVSPLSTVASGLARISLQAANELQHHERLAIGVILTRNVRSSTWER